MPRSGSTGWLWAGWPPAVPRSEPRWSRSPPTTSSTGWAGEPYPEDGRPAPRTAYGRTKLAGERAVLEQPGLAGYVVRTAWLYGAHGPSFVATMIRKEREPGPVQVVDDQYGQPTWSVDVADRIARPDHLGRSARHLPRDQLRRDDLVRARPGGLPAAGARIRPGSCPSKSSALARPAPRPAYSVLGHAAWERAGLTPIGDWRHALRRGLPGLAVVTTATEPAS